MSKGTISFLTYQQITQLKLAIMDAANTLIEDEAVTREEIALSLMKTMTYFECLDELGMNALRSNEMVELEEIISNVNELKAVATE
ncbi:hypothetical protein J2S74_005411 [Evansella vedderi]|uniref:Uncharacterized protein n=1 Tax=Evansella vedderi TaxID=38282 RepID=A0ABU0A5G9_9BACI|nr:hypothetical protein [Evansella vedderi]MDQ0257948.1 hypothetical protein [Evansella vedderi]